MYFLYFLYIAFIAFPANVKMILPIRAIFVMQGDYGLLSCGRYYREPEQSQLSRHDVSRLNARVMWRMQHPEWSASWPFSSTHPDPFLPLHRHREISLHRPSAGTCQSCHPPSSTSPAQ